MQKEIQINALQGDEYAAIFNQGEDITLGVVVVDGQKQPTQLVEGERLVMGIYNAFERLLCYADHTTMTYDVAGGCYCWGVTHQETMKCSGVAYLEVTLIDANGVVHSPRAKLFFRPYQNNKII